MDNALDTNMLADMNDLKGVPGGLKKAGGKDPDQLLARQIYRVVHTNFSEIFFKKYPGLPGFTRNNLTMTVTVSNNKKCYGCTRVPAGTRVLPTYRGPRTGFFSKFWSGITRGMLMASPWFNRWAVGSW